MSKKVKLTIEHDFDFSLIAIISTEPIYRLGYLINQSLHYNLKENRSLQVYHAKRQLVQEFPLFSDDTNLLTSTVHLIQNKGIQGYFIEEEKQVDFWLKWENTEPNLQKVLPEIKKIKNISLIYEVKPGLLKSKNRFLFSLDETI